LVDRHSRDIGATVLIDFVEGRVTNDEFLSRFPQSSDPALPAIRYAAWGQFSDLRRHRLTGHDALRPDRRELLARCCLFLKTNLEFEWPLPIPSLGQGLLRIVSLGHWGRAADEKYKSKGDFEVWPFLRGSDYEAHIL
jgi:hypothetical protein